MFIAVRPLRKCSGVLVFDTADLSIEDVPHSELIGSGIRVANLREDGGCFYDVGCLEHMLEDNFKRDTDGVIRRVSEIDFCGVAKMRDGSIRYWIKEFSFCRSHRVTGERVPLHYVFRYKDMLACVFVGSRGKLVEVELVDRDGSLIGRMRDGKTVVGDIAQMMGVYDKLR